MISIFKNLLDSPVVGPNEIYTSPSEFVVSKCLSVESLVPFFQTFQPLLFEEYLGFALVSQIEPSEMILILGFA